MPAQNYGPNKTMAVENQFTFVCPVFEAKTKIAACWEIGDLYAKGERPAVRRGCQVAMECGKCPMKVVQWDMIRKGSDPYHATDITVRKLNDDHLDRVAPVLIRDDVMRKYELTPGEVTKLRLANENATSVTGVRRGKVKERENKKAALVADETAMPITSRDAVKAAISGDMSAAINKEIEASK